VALVRITGALAFTMLSPSPSGRGLGRGSEALARLIFQLPARGFASRKQDSITTKTCVVSFKTSSFVNRKTRKSSEDK
jgi:hypothetical protein